MLPVNGNNTQIRPTEVSPERESTHPVMGRTVKIILTGLAGLTTYFMAKFFVSEWTKCSEASGIDYFSNGNHHGSDHMICNSEWGNNRKIIQYGLKNSYFKFDMNQSPRRYFGEELMCDPKFNFENYITRQFGDNEILVRLNWCKELKNNKQFFLDMAAVWGSSWLSDLNKNDLYELIPIDFFQDSDFSTKIHDLMERKTVPTGSYKVGNTDVGCVDKCLVQFRKTFGTCDSLECKRSNVLFLSNQNKTVDLEYLPDDVKSDQEVIQQYANKGVWEAIAKTSEHKKHVLNSLYHNHRVSWDKLTDELKNDEEVVRTYIEKGNLYEIKLNEKMLSNKQFIFELIELNPSAAISVIENEKDLMNDETIILASLTKNGRKGLQAMGKDLWLDGEFLLKVLEKTNDPQVVLYFAVEVRENAEIMKRAADINPEAAKYSLINPKSLE